MPCIRRDGASPVATSVASLPDAPYTENILSRTFIFHVFLLLELLYTPDRQPYTQRSNNGAQDDGPRHYEEQVRLHASRACR